VSFKNLFFKKLIMKKNILVTGAGGYIGTSLVDQLLEAGNRVVGVDQYFFGTELLGETKNNSNFKLLKKDIRDLSEQDLTGIDVVCDLAALSNDPCGDLNEELTYSINHRGRANVASLSKKAGVHQYILASSCSVYGAGPKDALSEESATNPISNYAKANVLVEKDVCALADNKFTVTALRQATVFGLSKRMRFDLAINIMTLNAVQKGKIFVVGGGKQWRPFIHVNDAARAFIHLINQDASIINGQKFNVGSSANNFNILSLAYVVRENLPFPIEIEVVPDDEDKRSYNVSFEKIKNMLGFEPKLTPAEGIKEIYESLKQGSIDTGKRTITVAWYKHIIAANQLADSLTINDLLV